MSDRNTKIIDRCIYIIMGMILYFGFRGLFQEEGSPIILSMLCIHLLNRNNQAFPGQRYERHNLITNQNIKTVFCSLLFIYSLSLFYHADPNGYENAVVFLVASITFFSRDALKHFQYR